MSNDPERDAVVAAAARLTPGSQLSLSRLESALERTAAGLAAATAGDLRRASTALSSLTRSTTP